MRATASSRDENPGPSTRHSTQTFDVLIVEDDPTLRRTVAEALQDVGYRVIGARDGVDALRVLESAAPWLILLDMGLPLMNGREFAHEVRRRNIKTKILVVTAALDAANLAKETDADGYIAKPFEVEELLDAVGKHRPIGFSH